jgi:hypothetical protein
MVLIGSAIILKGRSITHGSKLLMDTHYIGAAALYIILAMAYCQLSKFSCVICAEPENVLMSTSGGHVPEKTKRSSLAY